MICGGGDRGTLFGVYRFLETLGCRWLAPGAENEVVPSRPRNTPAPGVKSSINSSVMVNPTTGRQSSVTIAFTLSYEGKNPSLVQKITEVKDIEPDKMFGLWKGVSRKDIATIPLG